jgi:hypothetical protein
MALKGTLEADFSDFYAAAAQAEKSLEGMQAAATRTQTSIAGFSTTTTTTTGTVGSLSQALGSVDRVLATFGVNLTSQLGPLREFESLLGRTGQTMGALGKAGAVAAVALGAWKIGQWISDAYDLDDAVAALASEYMGWGNVLEVEAAEGVRTLTQATINAERPITDMTEAVKINADAAAKMGAANVKAAQDAANAWNKAKAELDAAMAAGEALKDALSGTDAIQTAREYLTELQNLRDQGLEPVRSKYEEIVRALDAGTEALRAQGLTGMTLYAELTTAADQYRVATDRTTDATTRAAEARAKLLTDTRAELTGEDEIAKTQLYIEALGSQEAMLKLNAEAKKQFVEQLYKGIDAQVRLGRGTDDLTKQMVAWATAATASGRAAAAAFREAEAAAQSAAAATARVAADQAAAIEGIPEGGNVWATGMRIPIGGNVWTSEMPNTSANLWSGAAFPTGAAAAPTVIVNAQNSFFDTPTDQIRLASKLGDAMMKVTR